MSNREPGHELLEREHELRTLTDAVRQAAEGSGSVCLIEGPAGIGKTSLLRAISEDAESRGFRTLGGRDSPLERTLAFGIVRQQAPQHSPVSALPVSDHEGPSQFTVLHELYWWLIGQCDEAPVLLVVDDAHWADLSSLRLLNFIALRSGRLRLAMMVATRPDGDEQQRVLLDELARAAAERIDPRPLSAGAAAELVGAWLGTPHAGLVEGCMRATGGSPILLSELLRSLAARGVVPDERAIAVAAEVGPQAVRGAVSARLDGLPESCRRLAEALAVLGPNASVGVVASLAGLLAQDVDEAIDALVAGDTLQMDDGLSFVHPLLVTAVYRSLPARRRDRDHDRAATLLNDRGKPGERVAVLYLRVQPNGRPARVESLVRAAVESRAGGGTRTRRRVPAPRDRRASRRVRSPRRCAATRPAGVPHR